jgi:hypothetical protein
VEYSTIEDAPAISSFSKRKCIANKYQFTAIEFSTISHHNESPDAKLMKKVIARLAAFTETCMDETLI